ncbi:MAG TPA: universal stress protein [Solirubrobacteraceae bacterium]|nr:universal stress protein [Solirubrobacteraceae bacterium]
MAPNAIISYDDTLNDQDALALGQVLATAGASLTLAYVRHHTNSAAAREQLEEHEAEALLERGSRWLGDLEVDRRVVVHASTSEGLKALAEEQNAELVIFGSDYRTAAGHVAAQPSTQRMLEGGSTAVAIAPANYRSRASHGISTVGVISTGHDRAAIETAHELADRIGATVVERHVGVDLLVVGSRAEAPEGHVLVSSSAMNTIEESNAPVLVVAKGVPVHFASPLYVA